MCSKILMITMMTILACKAAGQDDTEPKKYKSSLFLELATFNSSPSGTLNYELFVSKKPGGLSFRAGIGATFTKDLTVLTMPANISYSIPVDESKRHYIELGSGFRAYIFDSPSESFGSILGTWPLPIFNGIVGYRYMSGRLHIRATYMPSLTYPDFENGRVHGHVFGISCGIRF